MDSDLIALKQRKLEAQDKFVKLQDSYAQALAKERPSAELVAAVDACLAASYPYYSTLEALRDYLLTISKTDDVEIELDRNLKLIEALTQETEELAKLSYLHSKETDKV